MKLKLKESEGAVPVNNAGDGSNVAGLDNNPPKKTMSFKLFRRQKRAGNGSKTR